MAPSHIDDAGEKEAVTDQSNGSGTPSKRGRTGTTSRRSLLKGAAAAAATLGTVGVATGGAAAQESSLPLSPDGKTTIEPGKYAWEGEELEIGSDAALVGGGSEGDVVLNLESGTMQGTVEGTLENVVVRGKNPEPKAGLDLSPGATLDGFIWPEGGQQSEDRALYTDSGGDERVTIRNSAWGSMANNGAYVDKPPVTIENCAAVNNNIAGIRVGHRDGTSSGKTSHVRNCLIAVTGEIPSDDTNSANARGLRIRHPGTFVIEDCYFVYLDVEGAGNPIEIEDDAPGSTVEIRNCAFYNETENPLLVDETGGDLDLTVENCVAVGSGNHEIDAEFGGSGVTSDGDASFPTPGELTGYPSADEIKGVGSGVGPWNSGGSAGGSQQEGDESGGDGSSEDSSEDASSVEFSRHA
ncbi:right-handed parallel beta-helix repeat-containing protein (plasmid) [Halorarum halophilum]|uniref:Right-handed parallel beta-helix repeat-containing protein n=1 Tax=Halorarum halophilum TaxID=2743090 RepID=A0A7D5GHY0_9EURY|nr:right-handed parallel beta-helix repeat-containing protein [Halobaculum halophilum]QLG29590.1 right-handed parallel beta-helix repeat-containing protein [Halobaculum halophilum]